MVTVLFPMVSYNEINDYVNFPCISQEKFWLRHFLMLFITKPLITVFLDLHNKIDGYCTSLMFSLTKQMIVLFFVCFHSRTKAFCSFLSFFITKQMVEVLLLFETEQIITVLFLHFHN